MKSKNKQKKIRVYSIQILGVIMFMLVIIIAFCLFWRGLFDIRAQALKEYYPHTPEIILPMRGKILDREGKIFAQSFEAHTLTCDPREMVNPELFINQITPILNLNEQKALDSLIAAKNDPKCLYHSVFEKMDSTQRERIEKIVQDSSLCNYSFEPDQKREYPKRTMAAALIGWVGHDKKGMSGIELSWNDVLAGLPGTKVLNRSFSGNKVPGSEEIIQLPINGNSLVLTIDERIQSKVESILEKHVEKWDATGGVSIVINPKTGEILAMASYPTFDLNNGGDYINDPHFLNRGVAMNYEPGSVFKSITASSALELGIIDSEDTYTCEGQIWVENEQIQCIVSHGVQKLAEYLMNSCNCVFSQIGIKMRPYLLDYIERFNFGSPLPFELSGQEAGILPSREDFSDLEAANVSFGTSISVTPLQLITAYGAIINGGHLMKPFLVKEIQDQSGKIVEKFSAQILRNVISKETSQQMITSLVNVVQHKNGCTEAKIPGLLVGGKTGTAKKVINMEYQNDKVMCSFLGFFPADDPEYLVLVTIDEPHPYSSAYGSTVAAPAFKEIAEWIWRVGQMNEAQ